MLSVPMNNKNMDVSPCVSERSSYYSTDDHFCNENIPPREKIVFMLDKIELDVERLRKEAIGLEEVKDRISTNLEGLQNSDKMNLLVENDREDILGYIERIKNRFSTVQISVKTNRDREQEDSLHRINLMIDELVVNLKSDPSKAKLKCMLYVSACSSNSQGLSDKTFESLILGCTLDDQKRIKKRLQGLLDYIDEELKYNTVVDLM